VTTCQLLLLYQGIEKLFDIFDQVANKCLRFCVDLRQFVFIAHHWET